MGEDGKTGWHPEMGNDEKYGKRRQVSFRIGPLCEERLNRTARLFNMKGSEYVKAILYRDLGIFDEPTDRRRHPWLQKKRQVEDLFENEPLRRTRKKRRGTQETLSDPCGEIPLKFG